MERLQKALAAAGVASRRRCEEIIASGRVKVNGQVVTAMGIKVGPQDSLEVDGRLIERSEPLVYYLLNKPAGYVTTARDTHNRPMVVDLVPDSPRVYPVGRLDLDTEGLLLLTNDGDLTNKLLHPSARVEKVYRAVVTGTVQADALNRLAKGVELEEGMTAPAKVRVAQTREHSTVLEIILHEGRKRQVKRMIMEVGHRVVYLERIRFASLSLAGLARGKFRRLKPEEIKDLKNLAAKKRSFKK